MKEDMSRFFRQYDTPFKDPLVDKLSKIAGSLNKALRSIKNPFKGIELDVLKQILEKILHSQSEEEFAINFKNDIHTLLLSSTFDEDSSIQEEIIKNIKRTVDEVIILKFTPHKILADRNFDNHLVFKDRCLAMVNDAIAVVIKINLDSNNFAKELNWGQKEELKQRVSEKQASLDI